MKCRAARYRFADLLESTLSSDERGELELHLQSCAECRNTLDGMGTFLTGLKSEAVDNPPWAPPQTYWSTVLPRIHQRIEHRKLQHANPIEIIFEWLRRLALPAAAVLLALVAITSFPSGTGDSRQDVATVINRLPEDEISQITDRQQFESLFDAAAVPASMYNLFTDDDKEELAALIQEDGPALSSDETSSPGSDDGMLTASSIASNDDVFDAIAPELEQTVQSQ